MLLRRDFKSDANWYARDVRRDLGLLPHAPICPWKLADHLGFEILEISNFIDANPLEVAFLVSLKGQAEFSAVTICVGPKRIIVHNDYHLKPRQAANIAHEVAHGLLLHPARVLSDKSGARHFDAIQEAEANWLGPALLVSDEAAVHIVRTKMRMEEACHLYGVSIELMRMRLNVSGAIARAARSLTYVSSRAS